MSNSKIYNVIGIMSGTSMDGIDFSFIVTDGENNTKIIYEKKYEYSSNYRNRLIKLIKNLPKYKNEQLKYSKKNEVFVTNNFIKYIRKFSKLIKSKYQKIDLIGLSGQTIFHNPYRGYSIQLGDGKEIYKKIKIPIVVKFRQNDLSNGGEGAPIGSFYHKSILSKIKSKACIINLGGIANITYANKRHLISFDLGPANALIDDLCLYFYKKNFDKNGKFAKKGKLINKIFCKFKSDIYFKKNYPKSLDRNYFKSIFDELILHDSNDAIHTATKMTAYSTILGIKLIKEKIDIIILTGGGRKNLFLNKILYRDLKLLNIKLINIDKIDLNGDMLESQMFAYLAVRSIKKLPISFPSTTGVIKPLSGGIKYGKLIKN